ncbi:MAG: hypothetical protein NW216_09660 [Hyphomicrobium sp.]|nr:hypothetical protein [Hyphomicrobium sp.]
MRHLMGVLGVLAAGVLLAVSAAMNWKFGYSLGQSEVDGMIYGAASAAADCLKALIPFFFFAAIRNRMWSQAAAAALVGLVCTAYSFTSAIGHGALNRFHTTNDRAAEAQTYQDLRSDLARAKEQLGWVPQHRPVATVEAELASQEAQRPWAWTSGCTDIKGKQGREFCQGYQTLASEKASALEAQKLEARISEISAKLGSVSGATAMNEADPQATVLATLTGLSIDKIQIAMMLFIAILLEVGSGLGMYIAFSQWRLYDQEAPAAPKMVDIATPITAAAAVAVPVREAAPAQISKPRSGANDNKSAAPAPQRLIAPETDVERFYKENVQTQNGSSLTATELYEEYCAWCEIQEKEPLALPTFGREFGELGVQKQKLGGRVRYIGIALTSQRDAEEDKKLTAYRDKAA